MERASLIRSTYEALPPAPALVALARFTYEPGSLFGPAAGPGPVVFRMLEGQLNFKADGVVTFAPVADGNLRAAASGIPPYTEFVVHPDDQLLVPGNTPHSARSTGSETAMMMGLAIFPDVPPQEFPPGIAFHPQVMGMAQQLPPAPADVRLDRVTYVPHAGANQRSSQGPSMYYVESGALTLENAGGTIQISRAGAAGPQAAPETVDPDTETVLRDGDGAFVQPGTALTIRNAKDEPAVVLEATITKAEGQAVMEAERTQEANKKLLQGFVSEVMDSENPAAVERFLADNFFSHDSPPGEQPSQAKAGSEGVAAFLKSLIFPAYSDFETRHEDLIAEGDLVAGRWTQSFTHTGPYLGVPATGRRIKIGGISITRVRDGKIVEQWEVRDLVSWFRQIGLIKPLGALEHRTMDTSSTPRENNEAVVKRYFYEVWNARRPDLVEKLFRKDAANHIRLEGQAPGRAGIRQFAERLTLAFPDAFTSVDVLVSERDRVAARWTLHGHHRGRFLGLAATGKEVSFSGITIFRLEEQRIAEQWEYWDQATMLTQLGALRFPGQEGDYGGEQQPGEQQPGEQQPGEQQPGEQQPGEQQPGEQQPGEQQPGEQQPGEQQLKALVRQWFEAINSGEVARFDEIMTYDVVDHSGLSQVHGGGCEGHKQSVQQLREVMPDWESTIEEITVEGDLVTVRHTGRGTCPPSFLGITGEAEGAGYQQMEFEMVSTVRVKEGKIVEHWAQRGPFGQKAQPAASQNGHSQGSTY